MSNRKSSEHVNFFLTILSIVTVIALYAIFLKIDNTNLTESSLKILKEAIPDAIIVLIAIPTVYFMLIRKGISKEQQQTEDIIDGIIEQLSNIDNTKEKSGSEKSGSEILQFYENYTKIDWSVLLKDVHSVDMVVCYNNKWVMDNWYNIVSLFAHGGSMRIFLSDPHDELSSKILAKRFPDTDLPGIRYKINKTGTRLYEALEESQKKTKGSARLEVRFVSEVLNYAAIRFDGKSVLLSAYQQYRDRITGNSGILINLSSSDYLQKFWEKEFGGFLTNSRLVTIDELNEGVKRRPDDLLET